MSRAAGFDSLYIHAPEAITAAAADGTNHAHDEAPSLPPSGDSRVDGAKVGAR